MGAENPLKSIDFTGPGGTEPPKPPPLNTPLLTRIKESCIKTNWKWIPGGGASRFIGGGGFDIIIAFMHKLLILRKHYSYERKKLY